VERAALAGEDDVKFLARTVPLSLDVLEERYRSELRPYLAATERHDLTIRLWMEMVAGR
jgi:hypothetical protein